MRDSLVILNLEGFHQSWVFSIQNIQFCTKVKAWACNNPTKVDLVLRSEFRGDIFKLKENGHPPIIPRFFFFNFKIKFDFSFFCERDL